MGSTGRLFGATFARRLSIAREHLFAWTPWRVNLVNALLAPLPYYLAGPVRGRLYRWAGLRNVHPSVYFEGPIQLRGRYHGYEKISIGPRSEVFGPCFIDPGGTVTIGADVGICMHVSIYTLTHEIGTAARRMERDVTRPVVIEDGAWIGARAVITAGVTIGRGSVVGPGAVVMRDVPPCSMVQGNPARVVKWLEGSGRQGDAATADEANANGARPETRSAGAAFNR